MHRGPKCVRVQAQEQFEETFIGVRTDVADCRIHFLRCPWPQTPVLVIQKDAPVLYGWRPLYPRSGSHIYDTVMPDWNISPPDPRRNTHLPRKSEERKCHSAAVAASNDKRAANSSHRMLHNGCKCILPLTLYPSG